MFNFEVPSDWNEEPETSQELDEMRQKVDEICNEKGENATLEDVDELEKIVLRLGELIQDHPEATQLHFMVMLMMGAIGLWKAEIKNKNQPKGLFS